MLKKFLLLSLTVFLAFPCFFYLGFSALLSGSNQPVPLWWEIKIILVSDGNYKVNEGNASYFGRYAFTILWTGCMEKNDDDFILYYENSELISFKAEEKGIYPDSVRTLSTDNLLDKPSFNLNYILKKGGSLYFDFVVKGFLVPQNNSGHKFYLQLPSCEENSLHSSEIIYTPFVSKGSNQIFIPEKNIYTDAVEKRAYWQWKYQKWHPIQNNLVYFSNIHDARIEIVVKPHFSKSQSSL